MKTEGLNFLEAVEALKDGNCEAICIDNYKISIQEGEAFLSVSDVEMIYIEDFLRKDWRLIYISPQPGEIWKRDDGQEYFVEEGSPDHSIVFHDALGLEYKWIEDEPVHEIRDGKDGWKRVWWRGKEEK